MTFGRKFTMSGTACKDFGIARLYKIILTSWNINGSFMREVENELQ
jgi:hypothetical protein